MADEATRAQCSGRHKSVPTSLGVDFAGYRKPGQPTNHHKTHPVRHPSSPASATIEITRYLFKIPGFLAFILVFDSKMFRFYNLYFRVSLIFSLMGLLFIDSFYELLHSDLTFFLRFFKHKSYVTERSYKASVACL